MSESDAYRPPHGGYPDTETRRARPDMRAAVARAGTAEVERAPAYEPPPRPKCVWTGRARLDVTFSLADADAAENASVEAERAAQPFGSTVTGPHRGQWEGCHEHAYTLTMVGTIATDEYALRCVLAPLFAAGCVSVQVERFGHAADAGGYRVEEWQLA